MDTVSEHASVRIAITKNNYVAEEISTPAFDPSGRHHDKPPDREVSTSRTLRLLLLVITV